VDDVVIGKMNQFFAEGGVPGEVFAGDLKASITTVDVSELPPYKDLKLDCPVPVLFDAAGPDRTIFIKITNVYPCARNFSAVMYCLPVR